MPLIVGKNVLESLTTGMYADNKIIYREYIQNATDAIDTAIRQGALEREKNRIDIIINVNRREIRIRDNGVGIPQSKVYNTLGDIGKSVKDYKEQRGFRGIGRLGGLGYCEELKFITSYKGENKRSIQTWDCVKLKNLLQPNVAPDMDVIGVVNEVTRIDILEEDENKHYFEVVLTGIEQDHDVLLDMHEIKDYLSQVTPVPFNYQKFTELQRINKRLLELGKEPEEYSIFLNEEQIYKPYKRKIKSGRPEFDFIKDLEFFHEIRSDGSIFFIGWYGVTDLSGAIKEEEKVRGLRVRKHNILIGDDKTLNSFFGNNPTYQGYNKWFLGEIYVYDENLIPNARRDDFEKNAAYFEFKRAVEKTTKNKLAKLPQRFSNERSEKTALDSGKKAIKKVEEHLVSGLTSSKKEKLIEDLEKIETRIKRITGKTTPNDFDKAGESKKIEILKEKNGILRKTETLKRKVVNSRNYKINKIPSSYSREAKKIVQIILEVIDRSLPEEQARELQDRIIEELCSITRKKN